MSIMVGVRRIADKGLQLAFVDVEIEDFNVDSGDDIADEGRREAKSEYRSCHNLTISNAIYAPTLCPMRTTLNGFACPLCLGKAS